MKKLFPFICFFLLFSCFKRKEVDGIKIDSFYGCMESYKSNREFSKLVAATLKGDAYALSKMIDFPCGGGAHCYDLGFVITEIIYKMGEDKFGEMASKLSPEKQKDLVALINVGLEYGYGDPFSDPLMFEKQFPKLFNLLSEKDECEQAAELARKEAQDGRYYYITLGGFMATEFGKFHHAYLHEKYHVKRIGVCTMGETEWCFMHASDAEVLKKFGHDFIERTTKETEILFKEK